MLVAGGGLVLLVSVPLMYIGGVRSVEGPGGVDVLGGAAVPMGGAGVDAGAGTEGVGGVGVPVSMGGVV